jgi:hypothetical protein
MNMKIALVAGLTVAIGCAVAGVVVVMRQAARQTVKVERTAGLQARRAAAPAEASPASPEPSSPEQDVAPVADAPQPAGGVQPPTAANSGPAQSPQAPVADAPISKEVARSMLSYVGVDALAEEVWVQAINDSNRPSNERKDLIEDLNEDGFPDPHNVTLDDLPLIMSRIEIIERLAPSAMDKINSAAFQEARKDLVNMVDRLTRQ